MNNKMECIKISHAREWGVKSISIKTYLYWLDFDFKSILSLYVV